MPKPPSTWKAVEREVCNFLGWERTHWARTDGKGPGWALEVKHGVTKIPKFLLDAWSQACYNAGERRRPVLVIHPKHTPYAKSLTVISLEDYRELLRKAGEHTE